MSPRPARRPRSRVPRRARPGAGLTLLELLVAVVVSTVLVLSAMAVWTPLDGATLSLRDRARAAGELRLVTDQLLADLGGAESVLPNLDGELRVVRRPEVASLLGAPAGLDAGIVWGLSDGVLVREDLQLNTVFTASRALAAFTVSLDAGETVIDLAAGTGDDARGLELRWSP